MNRALCARSLPLQSPLSPLLQVEMSAQRKPFTKGEAAAAAAETIEGCCYTMLKVFVLLYFSVRLGRSVFFKGGF